MPVWGPRGASGESSNPNAGRLKNQEEPVFSLSPKAGKDQYPSSAGSQEGPLFTSGRVSLFVPFRHSTDGVRPTTLGRAICFSQSTHSNVHLLQKHPHRHTQNIWAPHVSVKLTHKINHCKTCTFKAHDPLCGRLNGGIQKCMSKPQPWDVGM